MKNLKVIFQGAELNLKGDSELHFNDASLVDMANSISYEMKNIFEQTKIEGQLSRSFIKTCLDVRYSHITNNHK